MRVEFIEWPKTPRLERETFEITEKIDGTNGQFVIENGELVAVGSRSRWLSSEKDNFGFFKWVMERKDKLTEILHDGRYYGEFYGQGIQRGYDLKEKRFHFFHENLGRKVKEGQSLENLRELGFTFPQRHMTQFLQSDIYYQHHKPSCSEVNHEYTKVEGIVIRSLSTGKRWKVIFDKG